LKCSDAREDCRAMQLGSAEQLRDGGGKNACRSESDVPMMMLLDGEKQLLNRRGYSLVEGVELVGVRRYSHALVLTRPLARWEISPFVLLAHGLTDHRRAVLWLVTEVEAFWVATQEDFPKPATRPTLVGIAEPERRDHIHLGFRLDYAYVFLALSRSSVQLSTVGDFYEQTSIPQS
jgi:hypothetical protein